MLLASSSVWLYYCYYYYYLPSPLSLSLPCALSPCKVQDRGAARLEEREGEFSSFLPFFFFKKQNSEVPGKDEAESKRGKSEPKSSPSCGPKMKKDFKACDPARRV